MKRFPLMVVSAAIGLALLAGVTRELTARSVGGMVPPLGGSCYYFWYTCSYDTGAYWDGCEPGYSAGMISSATAKAICTTYHQP